MPRITPVPFKKLICVFEKAGFKKQRQTGSHIILCKPNVPRAVVIPRYKEIAVTLIKSNLKSAGITRDRYFELLEQC